jgi:peptidoglycan/LPS O-acetylase OafA/YrhL
MLSIECKMYAGGGNPSGFDYLRTALSILVVFWHCYSIVNFDDATTLFWAGSARAIPAAILPMFFALSGFLVAGSLIRTRLHQFALFRILRIIPALTFETVLVAVILGPLFTSLPLSDYLSSPEFYLYFLNIFGSIHYTLPGVFGGQMLNAQLWTIPTELECYLALILLSIVGALRNRSVFGIGLSTIILAMTAFSVGAGTQSPYAQLGGRVLIFSFLAGVLGYLYRERIPYDSRIFVACIALAGVLLTYRETSYLAAFPVAYVTIWLGATNPQRMPLGDLSYGIFLFHFPIIRAAYDIFGSSLSFLIYFVIAMLLSLACAWISWTLVERPILNRKRAVVAWIEYNASRFRRSIPKGARSGPH